MKTKQILLSSLLVLAASGLSAATPGAKTIAISAYDTMKYSVVKIEAHTGDKITIQLRNDGNVPKIAMGHNLVLLKAGADPVAYNATAMIAKAEDYQPKSLASKVIAAIPLLGPKETASVTFTAPAPGTYTYLCSFPAHYQAGMKGVLVVK
jgi:azurin